MIDVGSLGALVGSVTLQRGLDYARRGAVSRVEVTEDPLRVSGAVSGSGRQPYRVSVTLKLSGSRVLALTGICSCPVGLNCKHATALVIAGLSRRREPAPAVPSWERWLSPLVAVRTTAPVAGLPLALLFELQPVDEPPAWSVSPRRPAGRTASRAGFRIGGRAGTGGRPTPGGAPQPRPVAGEVAIRPVQLGSGGRWVRAGIGWSNLGYAGTGSSAAQLEWFLALLALADATRLRSYSAAASWIRLGDVGSTAFWDLLFRAEEFGVPLIGSDKAQRPVVLERDPVELVLDVAQSGPDLRVQAQVVFLPTARAAPATAAAPAVPAAPATLGGRGLLVGDPVRAVASWADADDDRPLRERGLRLLRFRGRAAG